MFARESNGSAVAFPCPLAFLRGAGGGGTTSPVRSSAVLAEASEDVVALRPALASVSGNSPRND